MNLKITLTNRSGNYYADAIYDGKNVTVLKGAKIYPEFSQCIRGGKKAKEFRNSEEYVVNNTVVKECTFTSPSTAAQFITGRSVDGYNAWKVEPKKNLGDYLKERGLR